MSSIHLEDGEIVKAVRLFMEKYITEQEKKPLSLPLWFGYLSYIKLFTESFDKNSLQEYFPYAGFPMEWSRADEPMDLQQRVWQLSYQMQYCASIVEPGHFMEEAALNDSGQWVEDLCRLIDWVSDHSDWEHGIPDGFGRVLQEMIVQTYDMGNSEILITPSNITEMMSEMIEKAEGGSLWNPSCRTGEFLAAVYKNRPDIHIFGCENSKETGILSRMLLFYFSGLTGKINDMDPLEENDGKKYDVIMSNLPVGDLQMKEQERFPIPTRKIQLQYLQKIMDSLNEKGQALVIVTEGTLFKFDAEMKVREKLVESFHLQGVISLPADAFLPYTGNKASVLIFSKEQAEGSSKVWFYELEKPGYTLDKFRKATEDSQIPNLLISWKNRSKLEEMWEKQLQQGERRNQWDNPVPQNWTEGQFWFADMDTIKRNDYNLTAGRYKPWKEVQEQVIESPGKLLKDLAEMEQETMEQIKELLEMTKNYG